MGYSRAGFHVTGVDLDAQPRYCGDEFHQADALEYLAAHWRDFDAFHASPPCQGYSVMNNLPWLRKRTYPLLILPVREMFQAINEESGRPWVIENVYGARYGAIGLQKRGLEEHGMQAGWLCGTMFGLPLYRHRLFETSFLWLAPTHQAHTFRPRGAWEQGFEAQHPGESEQAFIETARVKTRKELRIEMPYGDSRTPGQRGPGKGAQAAGVGVGHAKGWRLAAEAMGVPWMNRYGTTQAVPPVMTTWIGKAMLAAMQAPCGVPEQAHGR